MEKLKEQDQKSIAHENLQDYFKEVQFLQKLNHPNIVTYYESFIDQESYSLCIVMELIEGFNLGELIKIQTEKGLPFMEAQIWKILIHLCSVLKYLHVEQKIVHRDLNPSNIMIDNNYMVKLGDFGLAKTLSSSISMMNSFVGTLIYSCPEIVQNNAYTEKADVWSLGCIAYELVRLHPPFQSNNPLMLAKKIVDQEYERIDPKDTQYSPLLQQFIEKCLTYDSARRPSIIQLLTLITPKIIEEMDALKAKDQLLNAEIVGLTKKMNQQRKTEEDIMKKPLIKIDFDNLNKIEEDPLSKFLDVMQKISFISNSQTTQKNNYKKFLIDLFYNNVILNMEITGAKLKSEISKLLNLSKNEITLLNIRFDSKNNENITNQANTKQVPVTYENMYFYIEELFQALKKEHRKH